MSFLSKLSLSEKAPNDGGSPVDRKRRKLIEQLDLQRDAVQLALQNKPTLREVQRWVKPKDGGEKQLTAALLPIRKWWWL